MSGYIRREDRLFDPTTGALVGYIDANGNEQLGGVRCQGLGGRSQLPRWR